MLVAGPWYDLGTVGNTKVPYRNQIWIPCIQIPAICSQHQRSLFFHGTVIMLDGQKKIFSFNSAQHCIQRKIMMKWQTKTLEVHLLWSANSKSLFNMTIFNCSANVWRFAGMRAMGLLQSAWAHPTPKSSEKAHHDWGWLYQLAQSMTCQQMPTAADSRKHRTIQISPRNFIYTSVIRGSIHLLN